MKLLLKIIIKFMRIKNKMKKLKKILKMKIKKYFLKIIVV